MIYKNLKYLLTLACLLSFCLLSEAKRNETIEFYYSVDGQVYKGDFLIEYTLITPVKKSNSLDLIDFRTIGNSSVRAKLKLSKLRWAKDEHAKEYKLVFREELIESGDGITVNSRQTKEFFTGEVINLDFDIEPCSELLFSGIFTIFFVLDREVNIRDIREEEVDEAMENGQLVGFQLQVLPLIIIPENYEEDATMSVREFYELYKDILETFMEEEDISSYSYHLARDIGQKQFSSANKYFKINSNRSKLFSNSDRGITESSQAIEVYDPDRDAYASAKRQNTINAYREYLSAYPLGKYSDEAERNVIKLTPFKLEQEEKGKGIYTIRFVEGVGQKKPEILFNNNGDGIILYEWESSKIVHFDVPEERQSMVTFKLYGKETSVELKHQIPALEAAFDFQNNKLLVTNIRGGKAPYTIAVSQNQKLHSTIDLVQAMDKTLDLSNLESGEFQVKLTDVREEAIHYNAFMEKKKQEINRPLRAILLAIPALAIIGFLLNKKQHPI